MRKMADMTKKVKTAELFDCQTPYLKELFDNAEYPWEMLPKIKAHILSIIENGMEGYTLLKEGVLVGEGVKIAPTATIEGPTVIGAGTEIRPGAYIRGSVITGEKCVIGNSSELKNCVLLNTVHGNYAHMGAGSICSNLKSDGKNIVIHGDEEYETGLRKIGGILGDHADIGCGCVLNPGTVIGKNTSVYPLNALRGVFPEGCIVKKIDDVVKRR